MPSMAINARMHRADDCMDAGGRTMQGAIVENLSVYDIHEDSSTELPTVGTTRPRRQSRKSAFLEMATRIGPALGAAIHHYEHASH